MNLTFSVRIDVKVLTTLTSSCFQTLANLQVGSADYRVGRHGYSSAWCCLCSENSLGLALKWSSSKLSHLRVGGHIREDEDQQNPVW